MDYVTYKEKLKSIHYYIKSNSAPTVMTLTKRIGVSRRTILRMVDNMRAEGINIKYCKKRKKYFIE